MSICAPDPRIRLTETLLREDAERNGGRSGPVSGSQTSNRSATDAWAGAVERLLARIVVVRQPDPLPRLDGRAVRRLL